MSRRGRKKPHLNIEHKSNYSSRMKYFGLVLCCLLCREHQSSTIDVYVVCSVHFFIRIVEACSFYRCENQRFDI